jgi:hypothetical protein
VTYSFIYTLFFSICFTLSGSPIENIQQSLERLKVSVTAPLEKQIEKKIKELESTTSFIINSPSYKEIKLAEKKLKKNTILKQIKKNNIILKTLEEIETHNKELIKPQLVETITTLLTQINNIELKKFLEKEKARLMDSADEATLLSSLCRKKGLIKTQTLQEQKGLLRQMALCPQYKKFQYLQKQYLQEKQIKKWIKLKQKIFDLEGEVHARLFRHKEFQEKMLALNLLNQQKALAAQTSFFQSKILLKISLQEKQLCIGKIELFMLS